MGGGVWTIEVEGCHVGVTVPIIFPCCRRCASVRGRVGSRPRTCSLPLPSLSLNTLILLVAQLDILGEERQDSEETRESPTALDVVEQLIPIVVLIVVRIPRLRLRRGPRLSEYLYGSIDDDVEGLVRVEVDRVACYESTSLEVSSQFVEDLPISRQ
jgi:hypothetical protein